MCGRFLLSRGTLAEVACAVGASWDPASEAFYRPRYNIAPPSLHWVLRSAQGERSLMTAEWGLINRFAKDKKARYRQINARLETLEQRPAYRDAFAKRRCAVPATGFYEWTGKKGSRQPVRFHQPDEGLLWLAGLYEDWQDPESGEVLTTFTIVTTEAQGCVRPVHHRMPAILAPGQLDAWLERKAAKELWREPLSVPLSATLASQRLNSARNDDPSLLVAEGPEEEPQLSLF